MPIPQSVLDYINHPSRPQVATGHLRAFDGQPPRLVSMDQLKAKDIWEQFTVLSLFEKTGMRLAVFAKDTGGSWLLVQDDMES